MVVAVANGTAAASREKSIVDNMLASLPDKPVEVRRKRIVRSTTWLTRTRIYLLSPCGTWVAGTALSAVLGNIDWRSGSSGKCMCNLLRHIGSGASHASFSAPTVHPHCSAVPQLKSGSSNEIRHLPNLTLASCRMRCQAFRYQSQMFLRDDNGKVAQQEDDCGADIRREGRGHPQRQAPLTSEAEDCPDYPLSTSHRAAVLECSER